ncbi:MAG: type II toxin-antitoxin system MqsR family toxin [Syntrophorhabdaceae bacterium]|jgi:motility quorum-sensing regulator/GCU-specific mRNA interferase toxin|nr:type II toxin-antitoxin system MqsR family toxin [Syntrophorhabdaceae bacterium]MDI9562126.1 type II toxin-antitoxin system MqsR family toxin [Pseudomonadota bacterium]HPM11784.1 type II toxin-antitoxin system MqsR family toxin [Paludibacter sp.]HQP57139.1 type II toxin-antitoxin system MqsR family toxin [Syntrophorhabdus sp.]MBP8698788.1 type II toxin-antitoxin system MqsR family toxin [Syntrophorhabdaceae bacterium]
MIHKVRDKHKPHYSLDVIKRLFSRKKTQAITNVAQQGAVSEGYMTPQEIESVISKLTTDNFYKSMTAYQNYQIWQDVYKFNDGEKQLYIKLQLSVDGRKAILIQFKKDEGE